MGHFHICIQVKNRCLKAYGQVTWSNLSICFAEKRVIPNAYGEVTWSYLHVCFATIKRGTSVTLRFYRPPAGRNSFWSVSSKNSIALLSTALLSTAAKLEREEWNTFGGTCTYAFGYLMGCFGAVSALTLAQMSQKNLQKIKKMYCITV